jgi:hypothetical protein
MWNSIPAGLAVFVALNAGQIVQSWPAYQNPWLVEALLVALVGVFVLVWARSWDGVGPVLSAVALAAGPAACAIIATQLNGTQLTSPANWVSGFCVVPIILLPFSRPLEEMVLGIVALVVTQAIVMADAGHNLRDLHSIVMSGEAGPAIGVGVIFLVAVIRQMDAIRLKQGQRDLYAMEQRDYRRATVSLRHRVSAVLTEAAEMLGLLATGAASVAESEVKEQCGRLNAAVRRELTSLGQPSLMRIMLMAKGDTFDWEIDDPWDISQYFQFGDQMAVVRALDEIRELRPSGVRVELLPLTLLVSARIVIIADKELPQTPGWRILRDRFRVSGPGRTAPGERQIYWWDMPARHFFGRSDDQHSDR